MNVITLVPALPSATLASPMITEPATGWASSFWIVPTAVASAIVAPLVAFERLTLKVSAPSNLVSPLMVTDTVFWVSPAAKRTMPDAAT